MELWTPSQGESVRVVRKLLYLALTVEHNMTLDYGKYILLSSGIRFVQFYLFYEMTIVRAISYNYRHVEICPKQSNRVL